MTGLPTFRMNFRFSFLDFGGTLIEYSQICELNFSVNEFSAYILMILTLTIEHLIICQIIKYV